MKNSAIKSREANTMTGYSNKKVKIMRFIGIMLIAVIILTTPVFADANYGEKGGRWVLDQIFWVGLVVVAVVIIKFFIAGNFVKLLITAGVGSMALFIIDAPDNLKNIGSTIWTTVFGG